MTSNHGEVTIMRTDTTQSRAEDNLSSTTYSNIGSSARDYGVITYILAHVPSIKSRVLPKLRSHNDSKQNPKDAAFKNKRRRKGAV